MVNKVCIFGSYKDLSQEAKEDIVRLGKMFAQKDITVMSGGFGGTMEDISRGAKSANGKTVGVTCYIWGKDRYTKANEFIDEEIVADNLFDRIHIMINEADALVVFPGGTGTLLELSATLEYINKGLIEPKPIIIMGEFWKPVLACLKNEPVFSKKIKNNQNISCCAELVTFVSTTDECVEKIINSK
ncbi:MAG: LOG family protein [archaeon]|nr:LOG family protein [Candidatus Bathyarchaeum sp.]